MKKFMVALLAVLMVSGSAWAIDIEWTGSYYSRGNYFDNVDLGPLSSTFVRDAAQAVDPNDDEDALEEAKEDAVEAAYLEYLDPNGEWADNDALTNYDHELELVGQINVSDTTFVRFQLELADENWPGDSAQSDADGPTGKQASANGSDDMIELQRVWGGHTFSTGTKLEFGEMTGGAWAYSFGDAAEERYRIKVSQPVPVGTIVGIIEKNAENGSRAEDSEKNDDDAYYLAAVIKAGAVNIKPLLGYVQNGSHDLADDGYDTVSLIDLGIDGTFGMVGFQSEFVYKSLAFDELDKDDGSQTGALVDVWANLGAAKAGLFLAYGSYDEDDGAFNFGDDFDGHGAQLIGNEFSFGGDSAIGGATYFGLYGNFAATDALSLAAQFSYAMSNYDDDGLLDGATAYELGGSAAYKITDAVTYSVGAGYAQVTLDSPTIEGVEIDDPDASIKLYHKLAIAF